MQMTIILIYELVNGRMATSAHPSDRDASRFYLAHHAWLQEWLRRRLGCRHDAADLAHDAFARLLAARELDAIREPRAFLTTLAQRLVYNFWRRRDLERAYLDGLMLTTPASVPSEEERALVVDALMHIDHALKRLPPKARSVFLLSQIDDLSYPEIAARLGLSAMTVRRYVKQAITLCVLAHAP